MGDKERFLEIASCIKREGIDDLMNWLEKSDFFTAPASRAYHGAYEGGLLHHTLNVYDQFQRLRQAYPEVKCTDETAAIVTLMHDFCKIGLYGTEKRNRKNDQGKWEQYDAYKYDEKLKFGFHGPKSMYLVQYFIKLQPEEAAAIACHMGAFENEHVGDAYTQHPIAFLLHVADEAATYLDEGNE